MKIFGKDLDQNVAVVAEIGVNHEGDAEKALELIQMASHAGADAVKVQIYTPDRYASATNAERLAQVSSRCLKRDAYIAMAGLARQLGIGFFATPLTEDVVEFVAEIGDAVKIASGDLVFEPTVRAAARTSKPLIISTGNCTIDEIDTTVGWCRDEMGEAIVERVILMHCVAAYPAPIDQANLLSVPFLRDRYSLTVGFSSHVMEREAVLAAVALGSSAIEVHFTDRREGRSFRDHELSYDPEGFALLVDSVRKIKVSLGRYGKEVAPVEAPLRQLMRKGVVAAADLKAGQKIEAKDLMFARPATEIPANEIGSVIGKTLTAARRRGEQIAYSHLISKSN